jgi:hypothetical protein
MEQSILQSGLLQGIDNLHFYLAAGPFKETLKKNGKKYFYYSDPL